MDHSICAIVVTYNRRELLERCLNALDQQDELNGIVVVNNASNDDTASYLNGLSLSKKLHVVHMDTNTGGAGGFHYGLKKSVELGYDYSWIMDDDAIPQSESLYQLIVAANHLAWDFGFLASNVISDEGIPMNTPVIDNRPNSTGYPDWASKLEVGMVKIKRATFVSVFVSNALIVEYGLPIREMFIWGDDSEFTERISKHKSSYFVGQSLVMHKRVNKNAINISIETNPTRLSWFSFLYRNELYRIKKHDNTIKAYIEFVYELFKATLSIIFKAKSNRISRLSCIVKGVFFGLTFNPEIRFPSSSN